MFIYIYVLVGVMRVYMAETDVSCVISGHVMPWIHAHLPSRPTINCNLQVIAFMDGVDCSACKTAKTNAMRLSASLRGFPDVQVGVVDCEEEDAHSLCYEMQDLPARPHAPVVKGYPSGAKPDNSKGEVLYNANEMEPHIALKMLDHTLRLAMADRVTAGTMGVANGFDGFSADDKPEDVRNRACTCVLVGRVCVLLLVFEFSDVVYALVIPHTLSIASQILTRPTTLSVYSHSHSHFYSPPRTLSQPALQDDKPPPPPPEPMWNGPARREPLPWNSGGGGPPRGRQAIGG